MIYYISQALTILVCKKENYMPDGTVPLLIGIIILILLSGFISSTETAYSCANKIKLRALASNGHKQAKKVLSLAEEKYEKLLSTILIGNNIVNLTASTLSTLLFAKLLLNSQVDSSVISTIVITVAVLLFGEITPKFIAKAIPEKMAMFYYPLILPFFYLFYLINLVFDGWKWVLSKVFRLKNEEIVGCHPNDNRATLFLKFEDLVKYVKSCGHTITYIKV